MTVAKPSALQEAWCEAGGRRVRYLVGGDGPPLVLVHGLGGSASNWVELWPELAKHRRVLVPELPGHGGSDAVPRGSTLAPFADTVAAVIEQEGAGPAPVVGHSLGGVVALRLALQRRRAVSGLVIASGAGISSATAAGVEIDDLRRLNEQTQPGDAASGGGRGNLRFELLVPYQRTQFRVHRVKRVCGTPIYKILESLGVDEAASKKRLAKVASIFGGLSKLDLPEELHVRTGALRGELRLGFLPPALRRIGAGDAPVAPVV